MARRPLRLNRWSVRRSLLGVALVLHVAWLTLAAAPVASARQTGAATMPCREAMMHAAMDHGSMLMGGMAMPDLQSAPAPLKPAPTHMPCCAQNCACAAGICALAATALHGMPLPAMALAPCGSSLLLPGRDPTPELRPPILH